MPTPLRVLIVEDNPADARLMLHELRQAGFEPDSQRVETESAYLAELKTEPDFILSDFNLPQFDALQALKLLNETGLDIPFIIVSGSIGEGIAVQAMKAGADDYLLKDRLTRLGQAVTQALDHKWLRVKKRLTEKELHERVRTASLSADVGLSLTANDSIRDMLQHCAESMVRNLDAAFARIWTMSQDEKILELQASAGMYTHIDGSYARVPVGKFKIGLIAQERQPHITNDVLHDPRVSDQEWAKREGMIAFAGYPLMVETRLVGVMAMFSRHPLTDATLDATSSVANSIALGIERKRTEKNLRDSENFFRALSNTVPIVILRFDAAGRCTYINTRWEEVSGFTTEESLEYGWTAGIHPDDRERVIESWRECVKQGCPWDCEYRIIGPRGLRWAHAQAKFVPGEDGKAGSYIGALEDITDRKKDEEQIREQAAFLNQASDAIFVQDLEGTIIYWNQGAVRLYGWSAEEALGKNADHLLYAVPDPSTVDARTMVIEKGEWTSDLKHVTKHGKEALVESRWNLVRDENGKPKATVIINTDVTEKKKLEGQLMRNQRLDSIGMLAGGIAHDLNNALTPIMMAVQIMEKKLPGPENRSLFDALRSSTARGADMVKQILSFARGREGQRSVVQPRNVMKELNAMLEHTIPKSITVVTSAESDLWTIEGDSTQLYQMLLNLCVNARDAMPNGGNLTASAANAVLDEQYARMHADARPGAYVVFTVTDTGTGIPAGIINRVFDPFFTTKEQGKGTGLGLSTVMGIAKSHGGFVSLYSEVGKGSKFSVYLPASESAETLESQRRRIELPEGHGELILVVDDESAICEITKQTLEAYGYHVLTAADGAEAIAVVAQRKGEIRAVITDMMMPLMDGPATVRAIRKLDPQMPIITASGLKADGRSHEAVSGTVQAHLHKPYAADKLLLTLRKVLTLET